MTLFPVAEAVSQPHAATLARSSETLAGGYMKMRTQMIAAALLTATGGSLFACGTCNSSYVRPEPVREIIMTRPTSSCYNVSPRFTTLAPVGERIYTRSWVSQPAPVGEYVEMGGPRFTRFGSCGSLEPIGERVITRKIYRTKRFCQPRRVRVVNVIRTTQLAPIAERVVTVRSGGFCPTW